MINIGIDAHILEERYTGVANYLLHFFDYISAIPKIERNFKFYIYSKRDLFDNKFLSHPAFIHRKLTIFSYSHFLLYFLFLLPYWAKRDKIDIFFFPFNMAPPTYWNKFIVLIPDLSFYAHPEYFPLYHRLPYQLFSGYAALRAKKIITISNFSKKEIKKFIKINTDKIKTVYLGVDEKYKKIEDKILLDETKQKYNIKKDFILSVGLIFNRRHIYESILAFRTIALKYPNIQYLIVGQNKTYPYINIDYTIQNINSELQRQAIIKIDYIKDDTDIIYLYNAALFSIYLSDYEGFGLPVLEAMSCGTPIISTEFAALKEIAGDCQLVVHNPTDIGEIALKMQKLVTDKNLYQKLIDKGVRHARQYTWDKSLEELFRVIQNTTEEGRNE